MHSNGKIFPWSAFYLNFKMTIEKKPKINKERTTVKMEAKVIQMLRLKEV